MTAALPIARIGVGLAAAVELLALSSVLADLHAPGIIRLPLVGLPYLPPGWVPWFIGLGILACALFAAGARVAGWIVAGCLGYVVLLDQQTYSNHLYLLVLLSGLLALPDGPTLRLLLKSQLTLVYVFAAVSKLNPAYLSGLLIAGSLRPWFDWLRTPWLLVPLALGSIAMELFIADQLWTKRRTLAAAAGVALHLGFVLLMDNTRALSVFGLACLGLYPLFWNDRRCWPVV